MGSAFLSPADQQNFASFEGLEPPEEPTNPVLAWARHPLAQAPSLPRDKLQPGRRALVTPQPDAPYPPAAYIDVNNLTTIAIISQAAASRMQTWYTGGQYEWTAWWQIPVLGMAYANLDIALGNHVNELLIKDLLNKNAGQQYMIDKYVDDQSWWSMFALRAYQAYGNETWLDAAKIISTNNSLYWDDTCGGGVLWLTYRPKIKNTITNALYFGTLARLYRYTGDYQYFTYAMNTLNWWLEWGFDADTGRVWDTITAPSDWDPTNTYGCNKTGLQTWTYNSGSILYGLADLYYATGNTSLLDLGRTIAYAAMRDFTPDQSTGVIQESCEHDGQPSADLPPGCQQDELMFKGILMMGMAELYVARPDQNIYNFVNTQLLSAVFNDVDDTWLFGEWWDGPWNETTAGPKTQANTMCLLAAAALINSDFLSKVGNKTTVNVLDQVAVPSNTTAGIGDAGTTARSTGAVSRASRDVVGGQVGLAGVALALTVAVALVGGVGVIGMA
ncbi:hypothetical protein RQP46_000458 [Phenoliferia psychrophenolica]